MEIPPLTAHPLRGPERAATATLGPSDAVDEAALAATQPPAVAGGGVSVVSGIHEATGAMTTTMVDADSGEVISQVPVEQVLDLVAHLLEQNRQRNEERTHHGEH